ncbi:hypothetical protein SAMD00023353_4900340 [Rosellinia necatrix]|uniref:Cytochrome p450 protein n=1 Tax=Rosellinia necatrix TaxID=77044 RepID=A0A1W2TPR3_ROSNE|nr:hypothetical protein SAMD00023353_4900340 [Rosellinia necatrix]
MSSIDLESRVYTGLWRDWSRGSVLGHILTLSRSDGGLVIALTAFFVAFVATRFWMILSLISHTRHSTAVRRHTLYHQQQVILRNSVTPEAAFLSLFRLWWAWRNLSFRQRIRVLLLCGLAGLTVVSFTVAGAFSSSISSSVGDKLLIKSSNCGTIVYLTNDVSVNNIHDKILSEFVSNAANYAQQCYSADRSGLLNCNRFVKDHLRSTVDYNASCPFSSGICRSNTSNVQLDSGPININNDLGLNADEMRTTSFRYRLTCAPLVTDGYTSVKNTSHGSLIRYHYGQRQATDNRSDPWQDFIYQASSVASQYPHDPERNGDRTNARFQMGIESQLIYNRQPKPSQGASILIPELFRPDGDASIMFLEGNGVAFNQRMDDDWYRATIPGANISSPIKDGITVYYTPEEAASPLGCFEQYQFCFADQCGPLASFNDAIVESAPIVHSTPDMIQPGSQITGNRAAMSLIWLATVIGASFRNGASVVGKLGPSSLASQSSLSRGIQFVTSPQEQWKKDVENWFNISLATLQSGFISTVIRPSDANLEKAILPPTDDFQKGLCDSQKIRSTGYTSFSLFGLLFTYIVGGLIIIASLVMEPVLGCLQRRYKYQTYEQLEWGTNQYLQLHRLAQEELGYGEWADCTEFVPVTKQDQLLGSLNIRNLSHPIITKHPIEPKEKEYPEPIDSDSRASTMVQESLPAERLSAETQSLGDDTALQVQHQHDEYYAISIDEARHMLGSDAAQTPVPTVRQGRNSELATTNEEVDDIAPATKTR